MKSAQSGLYAHTALEGVIRTQADNCRYICRVLQLGLEKLVFDHLFIYFCLKLIKTENKFLNVFLHYSTGLSVISFALQC